jgi:crotonobetainyl-CoA:carnitine CoA-transferase CaiB-like acyl-CoA transferase
MHPVYPLGGLMVVDLSTGIAGAYCAKQLADGGAEVIRLESPDGDPLRAWTQRGSVASGQTGALFEFLACSTKSVSVEDRSNDRENVARLLACADAIVWSPDGTVARWPGMAPHELHAAFPAAIVAAITPFGLSGPWAGRAYSDLTIQAWAGAATLGSPDWPPAQWGGRVGQWLGGIFAAMGVLTARRRQALDGVGDLLDVSLLEVMEYCVGMYPVTRRTMSTPEQNAAAARGPNRSIMIPMIEKTVDGWVGFMVATAPMWEAFSVLVEHPEWAKDDSLYSYAGRVARRAELEAAIRAWVGQRSTTEVLEAAALLRVPVAPIGNGATVATLDHFVARGFYVANPARGWLQPDVPYTFSGRAGRKPFEPAPRIGEHNAEIWLRPHPPRPVATSALQPKLPLAGFRVADFTAFWAGPMVGHFLAAMGAEVIHVESPKHPDAIRGHSVKTTSDDRWWEWSPNFHGPNTNKRDVTIDMASDKGRNLAKRLIAQCDVMLENYSPRVMDQWGLEYDAVRTIRPDIIFVRMPAFGLSGPWRDRTGYAQTMEQVSGLAWITGFPDGPPLVLHGTCDPLAGAHATAALLLALEHRERTGEGMQVEVAMVGGALNATAEQVLEYQAYGHLLERQGNRGVGAPQNLYVTADIDATGRQDTWVAIAVETAQQWLGLRTALGDPEWAMDDAYLTEAGRRSGQDVLDKNLAAWCRDRDAAEIVASIWPHGVPVARVTPAVDADSLEQHVARGFFESVVHPITGTQLHIGYPVRLERGPRRMHRSPAPTLGEHNEAVFCGLLGLTGEELRQLEEEAVIGTRLLGHHRTR